MGSRDYQVLPNYCKAFDVCMMAFAMNASTQYINPTKGLEYMATGKPIISTHVRDVVRQWSDIVYLAKTAEEFVSQAERAMFEAATGKERVTAGLELARESTWEKTVSRMQGLIKDAITKKDRRSNRKIDPVPEQELAVAYEFTPGS
jgi:hypothetical protein